MEWNGMIGERRRWQSKLTLKFEDMIFFIILDVTLLHSAS